MRIEEDRRTGLPENNYLMRLVSWRRLLPVSIVYVSNRVFYANEGLQGISLPSLGDPTPMACQIALGSSSSSAWMRACHGRSLLLNTEATVVYQNTRFRYLDVKGSGLIVSQHGKIFPEVISPDKSRRYRGFTQGLATKEWALISIENTQRLEEIGVRTVPVVAATEIYEVINALGSKISVLEGRVNGLVGQRTEPVEEIRAWVTPFRLQEVTRFNGRDMIHAAMEDIKNSGDSNFPSFSNSEEFLQALAQSIGQAVGKLHKHGYVHEYLSGLHNITLDGRIVDLDGLHSTHSSLRRGAEYRGLFGEIGCYEFFERALDSVDPFKPHEKKARDFVNVVKDAYRNERR